MKEFSINSIPSSLRFSPGKCLWTLRELYQKFPADSCLWRCQWKEAMPAPESNRSLTLASGVWDALVTRLYLGRDWKNLNQSEGQEIGLNTNNDVAIHLLILSGVAKTPGKWCTLPTIICLIGSVSRVDMDSCSTNVTSFPLPLYAKKFGMLPFPRMPAKVLMLPRHMKLKWFNH